MALYKCIIIIFYYFIIIIIIIIIIISHVYVRLKKKQHVRQGL